MIKETVLTPHAGSPRSSSLLAAVLAFTFLLLPASLLLAHFGASLKYDFAFFIPAGFWQLMFFLTLGMVMLILLVALISANQELYWVDDAQAGEIRLEDRFFGRKVFARRYPRKQVAGIRIFWQPTHSGSGEPLAGSPGWWVACLAFWDGKSIHLHSEKGGPSDPPLAWLARFQDACRLSGVILKLEPVPGAAAVRAQREDS